MSGARRFRKQGTIKQPRQTAPACGSGDHDPVDMDEARVARAKPQEVRAVVIGILVEGEQERVDLAGSRRKERFTDEVRQPLRRKPG